MGDSLFAADTDIGFHDGGMDSPVCAERGEDRVVVSAGAGGPGAEPGAGWEVAEMLGNLRREMPQAPVRVLIEELRRRKVIDPWARLSETTVYRFLEGQGAVGECFGSAQGSAAV